MYRETSIPVILVVAVIILRETLVILLVRLIFVFSLSFSSRGFGFTSLLERLVPIFSFLSGSGSFPHALLVFVYIVSYFDGKLLLLVVAYLDFISVKSSSF